MATLLIFRGDVLDREVELGEKPVRIGRSDQNDIVLPDPAKSVSRVHAELRFERGRHVIVDLNSQNGVWAGGRRVPQAALEPGVPVLLGTYRLLLKEPLPLVSEAADVTVVVSAPSSTAAPPGTMIAPLPPPAPPRNVDEDLRSAPEPSPAATMIAPRPAVGAAKPAAGLVPAPAPTKATAPARPAPAPTTRVLPARRRVSKGLLAAMAVVVVLGGVAAVLLTPLGTQVRQLLDPGAAGPAASVGVPDAGSPASQAAPSGWPETPGVPPSAAGTAATDRLEEPPGQVQQPLAGRPAESPPERPGALSQRGAKPAPSAAAGGRRGAAAGAAEARPKSPTLAQQFEEAQSAMNRGDHLAAIAGLEAILKAEANYPEAETLLAAARAAAANAAQQAIEAGAKAEQAGDYPAALHAYQRAARLDPRSVSSSEALERLRVRMVREGEDAFRRARQYDALGRVQEAISMYEKAVQLLPPDHASVKIARERLAALKGG